MEGVRRERERERPWEVFRRSGQGKDPSFMTASQDNNFFGPLRTKLRTGGLKHLRAPQLRDHLVQTAITRRGNREHEIKPRYSDTLCTTKVCLLYPGEKGNARECVKKPE